MPKLEEEVAPATNDKGKPAAKGGTPGKKPPKKTKEDIAVESLLILYPELDVRVRVGADAVTCEEMKVILDWETERDYIARKIKEDPTNTPEELAWGEEFDLYDETHEKNKVRCWNRSRNRELRQGWYKSLGQDILNQNWAGAVNMPDEVEFTMGGEDTYTLADGTLVAPGDKITLPTGTVNGETFVIGRSGQVLSGQHRGIGFVIAHQRWEKSPHWKSMWKDKEPVLETLIVYGVSEHERIIQTLDDSLSRTEADVIQTSEVFADLDHNERRECSKMLAQAVDLLWKRTGCADKDINTHNFYRTHSESINFRRNHPKLLTCLKDMLKLNKDRGISGIKFSPGRAAAMLYLMGASTSDGDVYRNAAVVGEKKVDWANWDKAKEFWALLAAKKDGDKVEEKAVYKKSVEAGMEAVRTAIASLIDPESGLGGRQVEKNAVISLAWAHFLEGDKITADDLKLEYREDEEGHKTTLSEWPDCGGIDLGDPHGEAKEDEAPPTPEQIEEQKAVARKKKAEEAAEKIKALRAKKDGEKGKLDQAADIAAKAKPATRKEVEAAQTAKAKKHDEEDKAKKPNPDGGKKPAGNRGPR